MGNLSMETVTLTLPADVAGMLEKEARAHRKPVAKFIQEWLEDQADAREAQKRLKDIETGKTAAVPWSKARKELLS